MRRLQIKIQPGCLLQSCQFRYFVCWQFCHRFAIGRFLCNECPNIRCEYSCHYCNIHHLFSLNCNPLVGYRVACGCAVHFSIHFTFHRCTFIISSKTHHSSIDQKDRMIFRYCSKLLCLISRPKIYTGSKQSIGVFLSFFQR